MALNVLAEVMLPVMLITCLGAWVGIRAGIGVGSLSRLVFDLLSPALVFHTLVEFEVPTALVPRIVAVVVVGYAGLALAGYLIAWASQRERAVRAATALCAASANAGNMGLPIGFLAFGSEGLQIAVIAFVTTVMVTQSGGIMVASLAGESVRQAVAAPLRVPALWAAIAGLIVRTSGMGLPPSVAVTAATLSAAAIPAMLTVLGMQVGTRLPRLADLSDSFGPVALRLLVGPLVALVATVLVGLDGVAQRTMIVLGGMPTAVIATIIADRFDAQPGLVSRTVVLSTLASLVTLTVLITLLR